jgi:DNA-directed RNA polymerase specialized sigma24 family protein
MCASEVPSGHSLKREWIASPEAFRRFLSWLDEGVESNGERYLDMRRRLVAYFSRKCCAAAEDLTDETLNRVSRRLEEEQAITEGPPARYCYIVARYVFLEYLRSADHVQASASGIERQAQPLLIDTPWSEPELSCLDSCLERLSDADRSLILAYYAADARHRIDDRRALARARGLTPNALTIRASRLRARLEACVTECVDRT